VPFGTFTLNERLPGVVAFGETSSLVESELVSVSVTPPWLLAPRLTLALA
jgi:hypothetical protein